MPRILVVDDDPDFCEAMRMLLRQAAFQVETAPNGSEALAAVQKKPPDLIILDVMMQGTLDGLDMAHAIEETPSLHRIPIIMVSSIADTPLSGLFPTDEYIPIDAWFSKPVPPDRLLAAVRRLVNREKAA